MNRPRKLTVKLEVANCITCPFLSKHRVHACKAPGGRAVRPDIDSRIPERDQARAEGCPLEVRRVIVGAK